MLNDKFEKAIKEAFRLSDIRGGAKSFHERDGQQTPVRVQLIWIVQISDDYLMGVTVVGVKTQHTDGSPAWYRGLLLVPPIWKPLDRDFGGQNLKPVDMEWPNSIITALESMNIVPYEPSPILLGAGDHRYTIHTYTYPLNHTYIDFAGYPWHKNQQMFWEAIEETVFSLGKAMRDREIRKFLNQRKKMILE